MKIVHLPVMLREVIELLNPREGGVYVDATVGAGGHSEEILRHIGKKGMLIGIDRDEDALKEAAERLKNKRCILKKARFSEMDEVLKTIDVDSVDGVLFDFGISMLQVKTPERGFSFHSDDLLDMRMDRAQTLTAEDIVNSYPEKEIERILRNFGEERRSARIAKAIVRQRQKARIRTCRQLAELIASVSGKKGRLHPATRTFQALRIAVNDELNEIEKGLDAALRVLRSGGRLVAISYHSLEDRAVKNFMKGSAAQGLVKILTKKPLTPEKQEIVRNPSARSAKLRAAEVL
jgi:16S rRNA (cytosine1402-N4)-methyltransferase